MKNFYGKVKLSMFPRIIAIIIALFLLVFSFDVIGTGNNIFETILAFIMHSWLSILIILLAVFWRRSDKEK
ncbi:MAG: hypothetical protein ABRQ25_01200 [Clostridiaceae bacterium]